MNIYPRYRIKYLDVNVVQEKYLIPQQIYNEIIVPTKKAISELEAINNGKPTIETMDKRRWIKEQFGENIFTDKSALFNSIETGTLSCNNYKSKVKIELI